MKTHTFTSLSHYLGVELPDNLAAVCPFSKVHITSLFPLVIMVEKFSGPGMLDTDSLFILPFGVYGYS